ncbi:hypothetical protein EIN_118210 [Entamoeba invadens IP1]|uniref:Uncharacterized protein n=1 Tax=Entamoeba invadens IP1 TaxID=370355 RepID=L7FN01_ENTIV|nr:hypothetical protein EIN_118210 [Entamoeba invadens IP1]ELP92247.1 hypothetical protein EIN_118210 [Entamoeba invadens IP1]|eukprot:XP_004259018.1 hypothetical protein EIN_118210 [Entamoeba invadens IP1]
MSIKKEPSDELSVKIILIGELGVGKTSMVHKYCEYTGEMKEILTKSMIFQNRKLKLIFNDTCGAEQMSTVTSALYHNSCACIFVYDVANNDTLLSLQNWAGELKRYGPDKGNIPKALCGNKSDLTSAINESDFRDFLTKNPMKDFKVCTTTGEGLDAMFNAILPDAIEECIKQLTQKGKTVPPPIKSKKQGGKCALF